MRALILLGAFYFAQGTGPQPPVHYLSLPVEQGPDAGLVLVVDEVSASGIRVHIELTNKTREGITVVPNSMPPGRRWWSPWVSISVTTLPTATAYASFAGRPPYDTLPCTIPSPSSKDSPPSPAAPVIVKRAETKTISTATIPLPEGEGVIVLQAVYETNDLEPSCQAFSPSWKGATKLSLRSNYIVVHRTAGSSAK